MNRPISFDFHGNLDLAAPIETFDPSEIDIYLDLDTFVGKETCGQTCHHCWFVNNRQVVQRRFEPAEGVAIVNSLQEVGFKVFPRYTDSFAYGAELMKLYGKANARTYHSEKDSAPESVMEHSEAWTSGKPLLSEQGESMLHVARQNGYRTITITFHGLISEDLTLADQDEYPIKGVLAAADFERVVRFIADYNERHRGPGFEGFHIGVGITLGTHNCSLEMLKRYVAYFNGLGIARLRFNNFFDHGKRHPHLVLSEAEVRDVYSSLRRIHETIPLNFQLGVSEDLGTFGIETLGLPENAGRCRAGRQLFGIIPSRVARRTLDHAYETVSVGEVVGCVNVFEPLLGELVRRTCRSSGKTDYAVVFFPDQVKRLQEKRTGGTYVNGCFAREIVAEVEMKGARRDGLGRPDVEEACGGGSHAGGESPGRTRPSDRAGALTSDGMLEQPSGWAQLQRRGSSAES